MRCCIREVSISPSAWIDHFKKLLNPDLSNVKDDFTKQVQEFLNNHHQNCEKCRMKMMYLILLLHKKRYKQQSNILIIIKAPAWMESRMSSTNYLHKILEMSYKIYSTLCSKQDFFLNHGRKVLQLLYSSKVTDKNLITIEASPCLIH